MAEAHARLREWSQDDLHLIQSVRSHEPTYANPGELRRDVRLLLAENDQLIGALRELHAAVWYEAKFPIPAQHPTMRRAREVLRELLRWDWPTTRGAEQAEPASTAPKTGPDRP